MFNYEECTMHKDFSIETFMWEVETYEKICILHVGHETALAPRGRLDRARTAANRLRTNEIHAIGEIDHPDFNAVHKNVIWLDSDFLEFLFEFFINFYIN